MKVLLLDHRDSFVHTLAGYVTLLGHQALVVRDDETSRSAVGAMQPDAILLSPGPCTPRDCPLALEVVLHMGATTPILGVCLGHQVIATAFGATVDRAAHPRHGMTSSINHDGLGIYRGLPSPLQGTRYHSLSVREEALPSALKVTARSDDGEVMGIRHASWPVEGVQFHPEAVLTEHGIEMVRNFLSFSPRTRSPGSARS